MDVLYPRCAGMDVHQESIVVCALVTDEDGTVHQEIETFGTMMKQLFGLLEWLEQRGITHVAMESTGIYWRPVYNVLEGYMKLTLANASHIKNLPGRKTDVSDAEWIAKLHRVGLVPSSFVPTEDLRELRELCRLRKKRVGSLTAEKNRIQKYLEGSNIKLGIVISDVFGVSGRNLLKRLMEQGYVNEEEINQSVHGKIRKKQELVQQSLTGTITPHQIELIRDCWEHLVYLEESISKLDEKIETYMTRYAEEYELLQTIPGVSEVTAAAIIAEIGVDMGQYPSAEHLCSWSGVAPGNNESAGKKKAQKASKGIRTSKRPYAKRSGQSLAHGRQRYR